MAAEEQMQNKVDELEMKLTVAKKDLKKLLALPQIAERTREDSIKLKTLENYYYDTVSYKLSNQKIAYRVRRTDKTEYEATIKTQEKSQGGFSQRKEYNVPIKSSKAVLEGFSEVGFPYDLKEMLEGEALQVLFKVLVKRQVRLLQITEQTLVEMAIDEGNIVVGKQKEAIEEIEFEIVEGNKGDLFAFVAELANVVPIFIEPRSKFKRGLDLLAGDAAPEELPSEVKIDRSGNVETEFKKLICYHIDQIMTAQNEVREPEKVLEADRVLLNRVKQLRAVITFVSPLLDEKDYEYFKKWLTEIIIPLQQLYIIKRFGRQWNKLYLKTGSMLRSDVIVTRLEERKAEIGAVISEQITGGYYAKGMFKMLAWTETTSWQGAEFIQLDQFALCRLDDWHKELLAFEFKADMLQEDTAREMRKIIEVMVMVRRGIKLGRLDKETFAYLKDLYRRLKILNFDIYGHKDILAFLQGTNSRVLYRDTGLLLGWRLSHMNESWRKVQKSWNRLLTALKKSRSK